MSKLQLTQQLKFYLKCNPNEAAMVHRMIEFIAQYENCYYRELLSGHMTASAWLVNYDNDKALLMFHHKLQKWLQPGGHADGEENLLNVALKEASEEVGINKLSPLSDEIFDLDIHAIPAYKDVSAHHHYDIRYIIQVSEQHQSLVGNHESQALAWYSPEQIQAMDVDVSVLRMCDKWQKHFVKSINPIVT